MRVGKMQMYTAVVRLYAGGHHDGNEVGVTEKTAMAGRLLSLSRAVAENLLLPR